MGKILAMIAMALITMISQVLISSTLKTFKSNNKPEINFTDSNYQHPSIDLKKVKKDDE